MNVEYPGRTRRLLTAIALGAAALVVNQPASAAKLIVIPALECPMGCGAVVQDMQLSNIMARNGYNVSLAPQETPGFIYNIRYMDQHYNSENAKRTIFGSEDIVLQLGREGGRGLVKTSLPRPIVHHYQFLWELLAPAMGRFFLTFDPNIRSVEDMKGKTIDLGLLTQSDWGLSGRLLLNAYGINRRNTNIRYVTPAVMTNQLINGTVDVATSVLVTYPGSNKYLMGGPLIKIIAAAKASKRKLYWIPISPRMIDKVNSTYHTTFFTVTLKPHTLPMQDHQLTVGLDRAYHTVTTDFPPKIAYTLVHAVIRFGSALTKEGGLWKHWSEKGMVAGLTTCNTNRGAIKAYKQAHIWKYRKQGGPPATIPGCGDN